MKRSESAATEPRGVKRERSETIDDLEEIAPPPKKALVMVDLTEDD